MTARRLLPIALGVIIIVGVGLTVGAEPFARGLAAVSPGPIVAVTLLTALSTAAAALRWRAVAAGLGLRLRWAEAFVAYYRSQFLNSVLVGGVLGDVHRAYRHGKGSGDLALAVRAVATERIAGQLVQFVLVAAVLTSLGLTSSLRGMVWIVGAIVVLAALAIIVALATERGRRVLRREVAAIRQVFSDSAQAFIVVGASVAVVVSVAAMFVVAALAAGVTAPAADLIALALVALSAASLPFNVGGWGPREAAAASTFAIVGLGPEAGVAASTAFGALSLIAVTPGAVVLIVDRITAFASPHPIPEETIA